MSDLILKRYENGLVVLSLNAPPYNMLTVDLRAELITSLDCAEADPDVSAIVLWAEGRMFSSGGDIEEYAKGMQSPTVLDLCTRIEGCRKPVVAALHGSALGAGFEVALAAHGRIATAECLLRLPEIKLGLLPVAGATQRLPRLCGSEFALRMLLQGNAVRAGDAQKRGIIERLSQSDLWDEAQEMALDLAKQDRFAQTRDKVAGQGDPAGYQAAIEVARGQAKGPLVKLRHSICQLVEAAQILPFETGIEMEAAAFEAVRTSRTFLGLKHIFFAEKRINAALHKGADLNSLGVYGGGPQSIMIVRDALLANMSVSVVNFDKDSLGQLVRSVHDAARLRLWTEEKVAQAMTRLNLAGTAQALAETDLIIDATRASGKDLAERYSVSEGEQIKPLVVFNAARDADRLEALTGRKGSVATMLTAPYGIFEILPCSRPNPSSVQTLQRFSHRLGRLGIVAEAPLRKPMMQAQTRAALWALKHGASPAQIDKALKDFGYRTGVFERLDQEGLDMIQANLNRKTPDPFWLELVDVMCATGRLGAKTKLGFYSYDETSRPSDTDEALTQTLAGLRKKHHFEAQTISRGEIQLRDVAALLSAGCGLLELDVAPHASVLDVVAVASMGFPRWRGGPMRSAQAHGLIAMQKALRKFENNDAAIWHPNAVLAQALKTADGFDNLDL
ncbi:enoyl-CoA hydratase-related protein [Algirhabdus cladophorae]|uniref:enoyl-CoA hydratase-related protein n=1 Tax=Algirhabdus cladophorae TaxID=3377108 RepID=UPI003B8478AA